MDGPRGAHDNCRELVLTDGIELVAELRDTRSPVVKVRAGPARGARRNAS
jgi:hypothetical protein